MKKLIFSIAALVALTTTSCKKAYECTCEESDTQRREYIMTQYSDDVATYNSAQETAENDALTESNTTVTSIDKTTKADANQSCASSVETNKYDVSDAGDQDSDFNLTEPAYTQVNTTTRDCSVEKK